MPSEGDLTGQLGEVGESVARIAARMQEQQYRKAILKTDWRDIAVVRIIAHQPDVIVPDLSDPYEIELPTYEIERYPERAPPVIEHHRDGRRLEVTTLTLPMLRELAAQAEEIAWLLEKAKTPGEDDV